ncbi:Uncharacterised protein [Streptococcus pyogenes]|nr:Uncharacterised protein [Streptococcus pyogenes]
MDFLKASVFGNMPLSVANAFKNLVKAIAI